MRCSMRRVLAWACVIGLPTLFVSAWAASFIHDYGWKPAGLLFGLSVVVGGLTMLWLHCLEEID